MREIDILKIQAEQGRDLYRANKISRDEAKDMIIPYINYANEKSKEIARKYNVKPQLINFISYVR